jgi:ABC-type transport system involved in cytochrome bd biosynthesis fused ATPase/permease subunit
MFDSPLDALDKKVSRLVARGILSQYPGKTKIIFSNTLDYWQGVDYVYFLENGSIVKEG